MIDHRFNFLTPRKTVKQDGCMQFCIRLWLSCKVCNTFLTKAIPNDRNFLASLLIKIVGWLTCWAFLVRRNFGTLRINGWKVGRDHTWDGCRFFSFRPPSFLFYHSPVIIRPHCCFTHSFSAPFLLLPNLETFLFSGSGRLMKSWSVSEQHDEPNVKWQKKLEGN